MIGDDGGSSNQCMEVDGILFRLVFIIVQSRVRQLRVTSWGGMIEMMTLEDR